MTNWFASIGTATSGLAAARYGLEVTSQNMSNASTPGYVRQVAEQATVDMRSLGDIVGGHGSMGGVTISGTSRQTDIVLDARLRSEHARGALADTTASTLQSIEAAFPEPGDTGLSAQLSSFWNSWATLANHPNDTATRGVVLQDAASLAGTLHTMSSSLSDATASTAQSFAGHVAAVNTAAGQLATLNTQIAIGAATGGNVNALLDQRDKLVDSLSSLAGASVTVQPNGTADVSIGSKQLVAGATANTLTANSGYGLQLGGATVTAASGSLAAETTALTSTLPGYAAQLDAVANGVVAAVNNAQHAGYDLAGTAGADVFSGSGAAGITVSMTDPNKLAASGSPGGNLDGSNALALSLTGAKAGSPDAAYAGLIGSLGTASALAQQQAGTQDSIVANVESMKSSVSGVSLDEEAANMLMYQQAFNASSRVLTTLDSMLDTLINHTGLVGLQ